MYVSDTDGETSTSEGCIGVSPMVAFSATTMTVGAASAATASGAEVTKGGLLGIISKTIVSGDRGSGAAISSPPARSRGGGEKAFASENDCVSPVDAACAGSGAVIAMSCVELSRGAELGRRRFFISGCACGGSLAVVCPPAAVVDERTFTTSITAAGDALSSPIKSRRRLQHLHKSGELN